MQTEVLRDMTTPVQLGPPQNPHRIPLNAPGHLWWQAISEEPPDLWHSITHAFYTYSTRHKNYVSI